MQLIQLCLGTLSILVTQLVVAAALVGVGLGVRRGFGLRRLGLDDGFLAFWTGLGAVILFLMLWNFFLPISGVVLPLVLLAGAAGLAGNRSGLAGVLREEGWRPSRGVWLLLGLVALWIANLSLGPLDNWDSALYHIQAVKWAESYPVVPGLANLDGPIAFNNSTWLFDALLSSGPWRDRSNHLANGLLILVFLLQAIVAGARLSTGRLQPVRVFQLLLFTPAASLAFHGRISSFVTDIGPALVVMIATGLLFAQLSSPPENEDEAAYGLFALGVLLALAVTMKLNASVFAATGFLVANLAWLRRRTGPRQRRALAWAWGAVSLFAAVWMGRGLVLSGYPLFPAPILGVPVEWRAPAEHAAAEYAFIVHSGKGSTHNPAVVSGAGGLSAWLPHWVHESALYDPYELAIPAGLLLIASLFAAGSLSRAPPQVRAELRSGWWLLVPHAAVLIAWFATSPEPRYAMPYAWSLALIPAVQGIRAWWATSRRPAPGPLVRLGVLLGWTPFVASPLLYQGNWSAFAGEAPWRVILHDNLNRAGSDGWFQPIARHATLHVYRTQSGLVLNTVANRCWDAPLPCTPNPAPNLRLRKPPELSKGFVVDGPWAMENWPTARQPGFLDAWRSSFGRGPHSLDVAPPR